MRITPRYHYTSTQSLTRRAVRVTGPLAFLKLALEDLDIPFLYARRSMSIDAGQGASFHVRHFDVHYDLYYHNEVTAPGQPKGLQGISLLSSPTYPKGQWLVSKHIAPASQDEREIYELDERGLDAYKLDAISLEMRVLSHDPLRNHPNIVDLVGFMWEKHPDEFGRRWPILVLQDADCGTLSDFSRLDIAPLDSLPTALSIADDIACGLEALHACGVVHGDLKFENILIFEQPDGTFRAKISDFGHSSVVLDLRDSEITTLRLPVFSRPWEAPEAYHDILVENLPMIDVYGFGLLLCRLMTGGSDIFEQYRKCDTALAELGDTYDGAKMEWSGGGVDPPEREHNKENVDRREVVEAAMLNEEDYDFDKIQKLKNEEFGMINYAKTYLKLKSKASSAVLEKLFEVLEGSLHLESDYRHYMDDIRGLLPGKRIKEVESTMSIVPQLFGGVDHYSQSIPEDIYKWKLDLTLAVKDDIINEVIAKSRLNVTSNQPEQIEEAADALYWLSLWSISGDLGSFPSENSLKWLMAAAENGSTKARARIWNVHAALGIPFPHHRRGELEHWLVDAVLQDEHSASSQSSLMELFPERLSAVLESLRTVYCGYGQDCFGDQWREEYPLESPERLVEIILHSGLDINEVHNGSGMACSMTWLHYAASMGSPQIVQLLLQHGSNPNILNDYEETAFYMACQAGHHGVACCLLPVTESPTSSQSRQSTELHFLDSFDEAVVEDMALKLLEWGIDIDCQDCIGRTPLNTILDRNQVHCMMSVRTLLRKGADPLFKDEKRVHPLSQAAVNLSVSQFTEVLSFVPPERRLEAQADVLWTLVESGLESLVRGGMGYSQKLHDILEMLVDDNVCQQLGTMICHPLLSFACASGPIEMVRILLELRPKTEVDLYCGSLKSWDTPLHAAVVQNRLNVVRLLLESGADPTISCPAEWTPLFFAVIRSPELVSILLRHVFSTKPREEAIEFLDKQDSSGATAFSTAVVGQFFESADILASYGTDYLAFTLPYSGESSCLMNILGWSCYMVPQIKYLVSIMDDPSAGFIVDNEDTTILHRVADRTTDGEAKQLLEMVLQSSSPEHANCRDSHGMTPLHYAGRFGNVIAVEELYKTFGEAIDLQAVNADGLTALDEAERRVLHDISYLGRLAKKEYGIRTYRTVRLLGTMGVGRSLGASSKR